MSVNPNTLTSARIPNAILNTNINPTYLGANYLRKTATTGPCIHALGVTKGHQYSKGTVADPGWRAAYTPDDDGQNNDGVFNPANPTAPSRFSPQSEPFEWWDLNQLGGTFSNRYVIITDGGTGGVGFQPEALEIKRLTGESELVAFANSLTGITPFTTEEQALNYLNGESVAGQTYIGARQTLVLNTNYPSIPVSKTSPISNLVYLVDFGFIPCYSRDLSHPAVTGGDPVFFSVGKSNISPGSVKAVSGSKPTWVLPNSADCNGGALRIPTNTWAEIGYDGSLNINTSFTIAVWFHPDVSNLSIPIVYSFDSNSGGYIIDTNTTGNLRFRLWNSLNSNWTDAIASSFNSPQPGQWSLAVATFDSATGNMELYTGNVVGFNATPATAINNSFSANTNVGGSDNLFIGKNPSGTPTYLNGHISLFAYWEGNMSSAYAQEIYDAYQNSSYQRGSKGQALTLGRYWV